MRGNMKVWIVVVWIVVAAWIWWNVPDLLRLVALIVVPTWIWWNERVVPQNQKVYAPRDPYPGWTLPLPLSLGSPPSSVNQRRRERPAGVRIPDQTVTFTTKNATKTSYTRFIEDLRARLASGEERHGIPVMRERLTVPHNERFIFVKLSNLEAVSITLAIDVTNAYVVAYRTGSQSFFLREDNPDPAVENLLPDTERYTFPFSGSYTDLERVAGTTRADIALGMLKLGFAIKRLRISDLNQQKSLAQSLIVVIQMVAEAVRFHPIKNLVCDSFGGIDRRMIPPKLDTTMLKYENNWGAMSKAIQQSNVVGVNPSPVAIMLPVRQNNLSALIAAVQRSNHHVVRL